MTKVKKLEKEIQELSRQELAAFGRWFNRFDAAAWGRQFEEDSQAGKLDRFAEEAISEHDAGKSREL